MRAPPLGSCFTAACPPAEPPAACTHPSILPACYDTPLPQLDTTTATWTAVQPLGDVRPPPRSYAVATAAQGRFYLFGGCGAGSSGRLNDLWEYSPDTTAWRQLPSSDAIKVGPLGGESKSVSWWRGREGKGRLVDGRIRLLLPLHGWMHEANNLPTYPG